MNGRPSRACEHVLAHYGMIAASQTYAAACAPACCCCCFMVPQRPRAAMCVWLPAVARIYGQQIDALCGCCACAHHGEKLTHGSQFANWAIAVHSAAEPVLLNEHQRCIGSAALAGRTAACSGVHPRCPVTLGCIATGWWLVGGGRCRLCCVVGAQLPFSLCVPNYSAPCYYTLCRFHCLS